MTEHERDQQLAALNVNLETVVRHLKQVLELLREQNADQRKMLAGLNRLVNWIKDGEDSPPRQ